MFSKFSRYFFVAEIKNRTLLLILSWFYNLYIFSLHKDTVLFYLLHPTSSLAAHDSYFVFSNFPEVLTVYLNLILSFSTILSAILFLHHLQSFLSPSFSRRDSLQISKFLKGLIVTTHVVFFAVQSVVLPYAGEFFLILSENYNKSSPYPLFFEASLQEFVYFYGALHVSLSLSAAAFLSLLAGMRSLGYKREYLQSSRRFFYCLFCIAATLISPPEVGVQVTLFFITVLFFEIGVLNLIIKNL